MYTAEEVQQAAICDHRTTVVIHERGGAEGVTLQKQCCTLELPSGHELGPFMRWDIASIAI
jgi:hypothetical protein